MNKKAATAAQYREATARAVDKWPDDNLRDYAAASLQDRRDTAPSFVPSAWKDTPAGPTYWIDFKPAAFLAALDRAARAECKARNLDTGRLRGEAFKEKMRAAREAKRAAGPRLAPGYGYRSTSRNPREPETVIVPEGAIEGATYVGTATIDGALRNVWRFGKSYFFQTKHGG